MYRFLYIPEDRIKIIPNLNLTGYNINVVKQSIPAQLSITYDIGIDRQGIQKCEFYLSRLFLKGENNRRFA